MNGHSKHSYGVTCVSVDVGVNTSPRELIRPCAGIIQVYILKIVEVTSSYNSYTYASDTRTADLTTIIRFLNHQGIYQLRVSHPPYPRTCITYTRALHAFNFFFGTCTRHVPFIQNKIYSYI